MSTSERSTETPTWSISARIWNLRDEVAWLSVPPPRAWSERRYEATPLPSRNSLVRSSSATTRKLGTPTYVQMNE
eukprot:scaffold137449_cov29-Tisochrysis_lutea.AAC.3